jgi:hypothetical protein
MEDIGPIVEFVVQVLGEVAMCCVESSQTQTRRAMPESEDNWTCPDISEFKRVLNGTSSSDGDDFAKTATIEAAQCDDRVGGARLSQFVDRDPLWDRDLDG